jgi:hypothetical protein
MHQRTLRGIVAGIAVSIAIGGAVSWPRARAAARSAAAVTDPTFTPVHELFLSRCVRCHGEDRQENGLRLDTYIGVLRGSESGPVVVPGNAGESLLLKRLVGQIEPRMPYQDAPLAPEQVALVRAWIDAGAPGPDDRAAEGPPPKIRPATHTQPGRTR